MLLPPFQMGDTARAGMAVAQIPDMKNWEVSANVGELDRGHLRPARSDGARWWRWPGSFPGHVKNMGGTTGPPWDRHFECRITLETGPRAAAGDDVEHADHMKPWKRAVGAFAGAVRKRRPYVRLPQTPNGFMPHDVKLVRRSESQAVLTGVDEGDWWRCRIPTSRISPPGSRKASAP